MWPIKKYVENNYIIMKEHDRMWEKNRQRGIERN